MEKCKGKLVLAAFRVLHCNLQLGHAGAHRSEDGFPWEEHPTLTIAADDINPKHSKIT